MLATGILFKEFQSLQFADSLGLLCGFLITIVSVFMLNLFRDMEMTVDMLKREMSVVDPLAKEPGFGSGFIGAYYTEDSPGTQEETENLLLSAVIPPLSDTSNTYKTFLACVVQHRQEPPDPECDSNEEDASSI